MKNLIDKEKLLHQFDVRQDLKQLTELLHNDFKEVGKSGNQYNLNEIIALLKDEEDSNGFVHSQNYECIELANTSYLLLYESAWVNEKQEVSDYAKRSSIWVLDEGTWKMKYHQGTTCKNFVLL